MHPSQLLATLRDLLARVEALEKKVEEMNKKKTLSLPKKEPK
jgi:hypothetical protein